MAEVAACPDPVVRNLQITQSYHDLAVALDPFFGPRDLSWCVFATWASKQAGTFIRGEEVPEPLRRVLDRGGPWRAMLPGWWLRSSPLLAYARMTVDDVSAHIAEGNRLVYARLAPLYASFLELLRDGRVVDKKAWRGFRRGMEEDATAGDELPRAFASYRRALDEPEPKLVAERILLGNALVGLHEQVRLQGAIEGSLTAPVRRAVTDKERRLGTLPVPDGVRRALAGLSQRLFAPAIRDFEEEWSRAATCVLMSLALPEGELRLGEDVPPLPDGGMFPEPLEEITLPELAGLIREFDRRPDSTRGSAARDWTVLADRMNYIVDLFRSRQVARHLLAAPFGPARAAEIRRGRVPEGPL